MSPDCFVTLVPGPNHQRANNRDNVRRIRPGGVLTDRNTVSRPHSNEGAAMPTINTTTLTLTTVNQDTTITVTYNAVFNTLERNLVGMGMSFHSHEDVEGVDGGVGTLITSMPTFVF